MDVGSLVIADAESTKLIEPRKAPLDDPSQSPQPASVFGVPHRQEWVNVPATQTLPDRLSIITTVA